MYLSAWPVKGQPNKLAVVGSDPLKRRRQGNEGRVSAKVVEGRKIGTVGGSPVTVLIFKAAGCGIQIDGGPAVLLGDGVSEKGRELRRSRTR